MQRPTVNVTSNDIRFEFTQKDSLTPSPNSIVWCDVEHRNFETAVGGKRQGVTKKKINTAMGRLFISKMEIYRQFLDAILSDVDNIELAASFSRSMTYIDAKNVANEYQVAWSDIKRNVFGKWTVKKDIKYDFELKSD